jgi:hypothetical protein
MSSLKRKLLEEENEEQQGKEKKYKVEIDKRSAKDKVFGSPFHIFLVVARFADIRDTSNLVATSKTLNVFMLSDVFRPRWRQLASHGLYKECLYNRRRQIEHYWLDYNEPPGSNGGIYNRVKCVFCKSACLWINTTQVEGGRILCNACRDAFRQADIMDRGGVPIMRGHAMKALRYF